MNRLQKAIQMLLPWPAKHERRAAIEAAAAEKRQSQDALAQANTIQRQLQRMARENHWAETIASQVIRGHANGK